jgi:aspartate racemase
MDTIRRLTPIWCKALNREVGIDDNFFECGGKSFDALRLGEEIGRVFGRDIPLGLILTVPTIRLVARYLDETADLLNTVQRTISLARLTQTANAARPIFFVHWTTRELVQHLGEERPIYALSFGLMAGRVHAAFPDSVENLAAHYIAEMQTVQRRGPYTLLGHSVGGVVAYEMAQQLHAAGEAVDFLGLLDTYIPQDWFFRGRRLPWREQVRNLRKLIADREVWPAIEYWYIIPFRRKWRLPTRYTERTDVRNFLMAQSPFWLSYQPRPYPGKVTMFTAMGVLSVRNQRIPPENFWDILCDDLDLIPVPGRHITMTEGRHARVLAARLRQCLGLHLYATAGDYGHR